jgi:hypothetical protein
VWRQRNQSRLPRRTQDGCCVAWAFMRRERGLRAGALSLSRPDLLWREGSYFEEPLFPAQLGYGAAGVVEALGPEVTTLKVGDQVSTLPATSLLDYTAHGETLVYPETALHRPSEAWPSGKGRRD